MSTTEVSNGRYGRLNAPDRSVWIGHIATACEVLVFTVVLFKFSVFWDVTWHYWLSDR
jgi:hypothetical protein